MSREFVSIFDEWVHSYEEAVSGQDPQYADVFKHYDKILQVVAEKSCGHVVEFGPGTGNLTEQLLQAGRTVTACEPNEAMRKCLTERFPHLTVQNADLVDFQLTQPVQSIVSTYVFHHLTDELKEQALQQYATLLPVGGKIVFADTVFESTEQLAERIAFERARNFHAVADDLEREYYTTIPVLHNFFEQAGFSVTFTRLNDFVFLIEAIKLEEIQ